MYVFVTRQKGTLAQSRSRWGYDDYCELHDGKADYTGQLEVCSVVLSY